ncbi:MAG TPA: tetratricopeptide repeat protein [Propionicimonas sp.]|nr:tetratricopeptide repeat protein [Propionicimonas sp.]
MIDPTPLWNFDDPVASEERFREAAEGAAGADRLVLLTQVARALGLQDRFAEGHATLDGLTTDAPEVEIRIALERGRLFRSAGEPGQARPCFEAAVAQARSTGADALLVDGLHMVSLVSAPDEQAGLLDEALDVARSSADPAARRWEASLLNNLGMTHADAGEWPTALAVFEQALAARRVAGSAGEVRIARWMVAWALRNLGRTGEALAIQRALKVELVTAGEFDLYVDEELDLLAPTGPPS